MVRYYFRSSKLSFKITEKTAKMQGFLLASAMDDAIMHVSWFRKGLKKDFTQAEQDVAKGYIEYLHYNGKRYENTLKLVMFCYVYSFSRKRHVGGQLLHNAELAEMKKWCCAGSFMG